MSSYLPPIEINPIFNPIEFPQLVSTLTISEANSLYLKLSGGTLSGNLRINNGTTTSPLLSIGPTTDYISLISGELHFNANQLFSFDTSKVAIASSNVYTGSDYTGAFQLSNGGSFIFGNSAFKNQLYVLSTNASSSSSTGAFICSGGGYFGTASLFGDGVTITNNATISTGNLSLSSTTAQVQVNNLRSTSSNVINMFPTTDLGTGTMIAQISPSSSGWSSTGVAKLQLGDSNHYIQATNGAGMVINDPNSITVQGSTTTFSSFVQFNGSSSQTFSYGFLNGSGSTGTGNSTNNYSLAASQHIKAVEFNATSSKKIKNILEQPIGIHALSDLKSKFLSLALAKYQYIDQIRNPSDIYYGLIAEDVNTKLGAYTDASQTEFIPNIYVNGVLNVEEKSIILQNPPFDITSSVTTLLAYNANGDSIIFNNCDLSYTDMWIITYSDYNYNGNNSGLSNQTIFCYGDLQSVPVITKNAVFEIALALLQYYIPIVDSNTSNITALQSSNSTNIASISTLNTSVSANNASISTINSHLNLINAVLHLW